MIIFKPLSEPYGSASSSTSPPSEQVRALAYLAEVDDVRILVDCGAPEEFRFSGDGGGLDDVLQELAPTIDLVLLCHSDMSHLGLYAYARAHFGLTAPCYTTLPVATMGRLTVLEATQALRAENDFDGDNAKQDDMLKRDEQERDQSAVVSKDAHWCIGSVEEINEAFEQIITLRYLQPTQLSGKCAGLTLTAYNSGHSLGGAIWKLRSPSSGTLLIALDWNHNRERHIDGTSLVASSGSTAMSAARGGGGGGSDGSSAIADAIRRPDLLITTMARSKYTNARRKDRDAALLQTIHETIRGGNSVLMPVDAASRLLELLVLLDQHWAFAYPTVRFPLCLVSNTGREMLERARTLMEWMTREWARKGEESAMAAAAAANADDDGPGPRNKRQRTGRMNNANAPSSPLDFKFLRIFSSLAAMDETLSPTEAKVVLAWPPSLSHGPARKLVARMASNPQNVILLTGQGEPGTLTRTLYDEWERNQTPAAHWGKGSVGVPVQANSRVQLQIHDKVALSGDELEAFNEAKRLVNEKAAQQRALLARSTRRVEADDDDVSSGSGSSDDESDEDDGMLDEKAAGGDGESGALATRKRTKGALEETQQDADGFPVQEISFDIYLKGSASRATTFFGSSGERSSGRYKTGVRYRTFPVVERKKRIDAYGETLDLSKWLHRRKQLEAIGGEQAEAQTLEDQKATRQRQQVQEDREADQRRKEQEPPSKFITELVDVHVQCKVLFIEMDGLGDSRALQAIIPQLEPRRVIFVESKTAEQRSELHDAFARLRGMTNEIHMPIVGQSVEIGESTASFTVKLGEEVMGSLRFSSFQDYQVALVRGCITFRTESSIPVLEPFGSTSIKEMAADEATENGANGSQDEDHKPTVVKAEPQDVPINLDEDDVNTSTATILQPTTLFVGDLKLSSLKQNLAALQKPGIPSEFVGQGTLVCGSSAFRSGANPAHDDVVTVRKENQGEIVIEGNASRNFYRVREAVYALHAQVTGQQ